MNFVLSSLAFLAICAAVAVALLPIYLVLKLAQSKGKKKDLKK